MICRLEMDVMEAIKTRRSIRRYKTNPVGNDDVLLCIEAAIWAPSADNSQPWEFVIVKDPETRKRLAEIHSWGRFMKDSPVVIVVLADPNRSPNYYHIDAAAATQNMLLAAHSLGLGTCWMGVMNTSFEEPIRNLLGIPKYLRILCTISLGYPDESPRKSRRKLEEMVHWEKY